MTQNLKKILKRIRPKNPVVYRRAVWIFIGITLVFAVVRPVLAVNQNPQDAALDNPITSNPFAESIWKFGTPEEALVLTNGDCDSDFSSGLVPTVLELGNTIVGVGGFQTTCALDDLAEGDPTKLIALIENNESLNSAVARANTELLTNQRPASGINFIEEKVYALTHPGQVYAQDGNPEALYYRGTGFDLLKPVQSFWGFSVNIVYGILILVIVAVAFAIMFRAQLPGGTVVTIQNSIPNIALAMLLVPLSYAISGLFIDGITVGVNVTHQFLLGPGAPAREVYENRKEAYPLDRLIETPISDSEGDRGLHADDIRVNWLYSSSSLGVQDDITDFAEGIVVIANVQDGLGETVLSGLAGFIAPLINFIVGIILLLTGLRIFWLLVNKFVVFMIGPLFAPFVFATVAMPGGGIQNVVMYAKALLSGTLYYVVAYAMILLSIIFSSNYFQAKIANAGTPTFTPPLLGLEGPGFAEGAVINNGIIGFYTALISLGIYMMIPKVLKSIDEALGVTGAVPFVSDIFQSARDSINMARSGGSAAAKGAGFIRRNNPYDLTIKGRQALRRNNQSLRNLGDRLRGRRAGERGSALFRQRQKLGGARAEAERMRREALANRNMGEVRRMDRRLRRLDEQMEALNSSAGIDSDFAEAQEASIKADVTWNGQPGPVTITKEQVQGYVSRGAGSDIAFKLVKGTVKLKAENFKFSPNEIRNIQIYSEQDGLVPYTSDKTYKRGGIGLNANIGEGDLRGGDFKIQPGATPWITGTQIQSGTPGTPIGSRGIMEFKIGNVKNFMTIVTLPMEASPSSDGSELYFDFELHISDVLSLFGTSATPGALTPLNGYSASYKYKIRLADLNDPTNANGAIDSNVFDIKFQSNYVPGSGSI